RKVNLVLLLRLSLFLMAVSVVLTSMAPSFFALLACMALFGFSVGLVGPAQNSLATIGSEPRYRQQILAGLHSTYGLASLMIPFLVSVAIRSWGLEWKEIFLLTAIVPFGVLIWSFSLNADLMRPSLLQQSHGQNQSDILAPTPWKTALILCFMVGIFVVGEVMVSTRISLLSQRVLGYDTSQGSLIAAGFFATLFIGRLMFALIQVRKPLEFQLQMSMWTTFAVMVLGILVHPWILMLTGFTIAGFYPIALNFMSVEFDHHIRSIIPMVLTIQAALLSTMHVSVGMIADIVGLQNAFWLGPLCCLIAWILLRIYLIMRKTAYVGNT
ncbi:MAG TPA: MFS transporter, partial [Pseudobdellovibrionaceae bacterium]|nr:MFS transporter [Pseudobdellovibrionaceae bacterium]